MTATRIARERGVSPSSDEGAAIARFASAMAGLAHEDAARARAHLRVKYDPRGARYWELVAVTKGEPPVGQFDDWRWLGEALRHHARAA